MLMKLHKNIYVECSLLREWAKQLNNLDVAIKQRMIKKHRKHVKKWVKKEKQDLRFLRVKRWAK